MNKIIKINNIKSIGKIVSIIFVDIIRKLKRSSNIKNHMDHIQKGIEWLSLAQDMSSDGGVPIRYSLVAKSNWHSSGWNAPYPETTGYIIPTFYEYAKMTNNGEYKNRANLMADWLLSVQGEDGSIKGGDINSGMGKIVFDVGQVVFGLLSAFRNTEHEKYLNAAQKAGDWLVRFQNSNGTWDKYSFNSIPHSYHSRVSWSLLELYQIVKEEKYLDSARKNIEWVISNQKSNGWFYQAGFSLEDHKAPLTHTIAYTIRGVLECGLILSEEEYILSAKRSADAIANLINSRGFLPGRFNSKWETSYRFSCLTGNAQISIIFLKLYEIVKDAKYLNLARKLNEYLMSMQSLNTKHDEIRGAIPGSSPVWGGYESFSYPNWATKFFVDALMLEQSIVN